MLQLFAKAIAFLTVAATILATSSSIGLAQTKTGSVVDSRILLGFKIDDALMKQVLPEGWNSFTIPKGPVGGANLLIALIDRHLILDAEGKASTPSSGPIVVILTYGRMGGVKGVRTFVTHVYEEPPLVDPYGNSIPADLDRVASYLDKGRGHRIQAEKWVVQPNGGGELTFDLEFALGGLSWATDVGSRPYSSKDPNAFRIFSYDQLTATVMNRTMAIELDGEVSISVGDPNLAPLFNGNEALVSIVSVPVQVREVFAP